MVFYIYLWFHSEGDIVIVYCGVSGRVGGVVFSTAGVLSQVKLEMCRNFNITTNDTNENLTANIK